LEGLEAVEIQKSYVIKDNKYFRIDDGYFNKRFLKALKQIEVKPFNKLIDVSTLITDFGAFSQMNFVEYIDNGVLFLRNQDVKENNIEVGNSVFVDSTVYQRLSLKLEENDIVIPRAGTLGNAAVITKDILPATANQNLAQIKPNLSLIKPYFVSTFLCSKFGLLQIERASTGNVQQWLNLENINNIKISILTIFFQAKIENTVLLAISKLKASKQTYAQAEEILLAEIGLKDFEPSKDPVNIKNFSDSFAISGRLDAEYYKKSYETIEEKILEYPSGYTDIATEFELIKETSRREKPTYNYIEISDVNVSDGAASYNRIDIENLPANAKQEVKRGDLLISKVRPNRGAVAIIDFDDTDLIVSGAFTVLREKESSKFSNETLKVLLRTDFYREWLLKFNIGTQYPVIRDDDILSLPIPIVSEKNQNEIASLVKESFALKKQSEKLLEVAKLAVEIAIEKDEPTALQYIKDNE